MAYCQWKEKQIKTFSVRAISIFQIFISDFSHGLVQFQYVNLFFVSIACYGKKKNDKALLVPVLLWPLIYSYFN